METHQLEISMKTTAPFSQRGNGNNKKKIRFLTKGCMPGSCSVASKPGDLDDSSLYLRKSINLNLTD